MAAARGRDAVAALPVLLQGRPHFSPTVERWQPIDLDAKDSAGSGGQLRTAPC